MDRQSGRQKESVQITREAVSSLATISNRGTVLTQGSRFPGFLAVIMYLITFSRRYHQTL